MEGLEGLGELEGLEGLGELEGLGAGEAGGAEGIVTAPSRLWRRKGYPLQYSGLENSMDCLVYGVAKSHRQGNPLVLIC